MVYFYEKGECVVEKIKKLIRSFSNMTYAVSLAVIGSLSIEEGTFSLPIYQVIVTIYIVSGVIKYASTGFTKELFKDMLRDFITSFSIVLILLKTTNYKDYSAISSISIILMHNIVLIFIFGLIHISEKEYGKIAFFSWPLYFVIALILIKIGFSVIIALIIAVLLIQPLNYYGYKKKRTTENN